MPVDSVVEKRTDNGGSWKIKTKELKGEKNDYFADEKDLFRKNQRFVSTFK